MKVSQSTLLTSLLLISFSVYEGCHSVKRITDNRIIDVSGQWNDTDSRLVAEWMSASITDPRASWHINFAADQPGLAKRKPMIILGMLVNETQELHINGNTFISVIEKNLITTNIARVLAHSTFRAALEKEVNYQQKNMTQDTCKRLGKQMGADFMLFGTIRSIVDATRSKQMLLYQVDLELINIETGEKVWKEVKEHRKYVKN